MLYNAAGTVEYIKVNDGSVSSISDGFSPLICPAALCGRSRCLQPHGWGSRLTALRALPEASSSQAGQLDSHSNE